MSESNYVILCSAVLPKSLKTITQDTFDYYEEDCFNLKEYEQYIRRKSGGYEEILNCLNLTAKEIEIENIQINITIVSRNLNKHHQFTI